MWFGLSIHMIAGVHDSYWTHACDVDEMNRILREKFVELYEIPILENVQYLPCQIFFTLFVEKNFPEEFLSDEADLF